MTPDALYAVDLAAQGRPDALPAMDRTRELGVLEFAGTPALPIGGREATALLVDRAATACSAEMLGAADQVLDMTVAYAKDRVQFGKPIGSFQAIKHMLADALVDLEGMRSTAYYAAWCVGADDPERSLAASMAKSWCSDASRRIMAAGLQVHGGIGFTWEHDMHLYVKRSQLDQVSFGDAAFHRDRIATMLQERLVAGQEIA
jgi:alkylation response protein AidB-like acyl-CoA dehydrogenase